MIYHKQKHTNSDFVKIGKEFHRWVRDESRALWMKLAKCIKWRYGLWDPDTL